MKARQLAACAAKECHCEGQKLSGGGKEFQSEGEESHCEGQQYLAAKCSSLYFWATVQLTLSVEVCQDEPSALSRSKVAGIMAHIGESPTCTLPPRLRHPTFHHMEPIHIVHQGHHTGDRYDSQHDCNPHQILERFEDLGEREGFIIASLHDETDTVLHD